MIWRRVESRKRTRTGAIERGDADEDDRDEDSDGDGHGRKDGDDNPDLRRFFRDLQTVESTRYLRLSRHCRLASSSLAGRDDDNTTSDGDDSGGVDVGFDDR